MKSSFKIYISCKVETGTGTYFISTCNQHVIITVYLLHRTTSLCSHIFLVLRDHGVYMYVVYI